MENIVYSTFYAALLHWRNAAQKSMAPIGEIHATSQHCIASLAR